MERLQKIIAHSGYTSRRKAEELIVAGKVTVNGVVVKELGTRVNRNDDIMVDGNIISIEEKVYYVLYKPEGYISTTDDEKGRKTVLDLAPEKERLYPVGRLDQNTSGIIKYSN